MLITLALLLSSSLFYITGVISSITENSTTTTTSKMQVFYNLYIKEESDKERVENLSKEVF
jgi:hypothetical protein